MPISFTIRLQTGSSLHLEAELSDTVLVLKETLLTIVKERSWHPHTCRLLYLGKDLSLHSTLGECGMSEGASVVLHLLGPPPSAHPPHPSSAHPAVAAAASTKASTPSSALPGHQAASAPSAATPVPPPTAGATPSPPTLPPTPTTTTNIHDIVALRHALGVALGERDAARGEVKSLQERLLNCEERLQRTSTTFESLAQQLSQLSTVATEAQVNLFNS